MGPWGPRAHGQGQQSFTRAKQQLLQEEAPLAAVYTNSSSLHWIPKETRHLVSTEVFPSGEKKLSKEFQDPFKNFTAVSGHLRLEHVL